MISFKHFSGLLNAVKRESQQIAELTFALKRFYQGVPFDHPDPPSVSYIYEYLKEVCLDYENNWIEYFIDELNWGEYYREGMVVVNGKTVQLATIEDLYELLLKNAQTK